MQVRQAWTPSLLKKRIPSLISRLSHNSRFYALCCLLVRWICFIGRPFVKRFTLCYRTVVLSVWPHCVRRGPSPPPPKGHSPAIFGPYLLRPTGWMDQDATWYGSRHWPRRLCVGWGPSSPPQKGELSCRKFSAHVRCGQTAGWVKMPIGMQAGLSQSDIVLDGDPAPPSHKRGRARPQFLAHVYCRQTAV